MLLRTYHLLVFAAICLLSGCAANIDTAKDSRTLRPDPIIRIEMNLSAFGVESDDFPSIVAMIDLTKDSSHCEKSYYNPAYKGSSYALSKEDLKKIHELLGHTDPEKLVTKYSSNKSDQPTSTTTIYTAKKKYIIEDYGLQAEEPIQQLYKIVYKL